MLHFKQTMACLPNRIFNSSSRMPLIKHFALLICVALVTLSPAMTLAETPDEWVELGQRVHGGFGSYVALGIRIGLDAVDRLDAQPRDLDVTYYSGASAPCPCVVDGIMIATVATPGQNSLRVAPTPSEPETFGRVEIINQRTGQALRYTIPNSAQDWLDQWNRNTTGRERYDAVMNAPEADLFSVEVLP